MKDYIEDSLDRLEEEEERSWDWHEAAAVLPGKATGKSGQAAAQSRNGTARREAAAEREGRRKTHADPEAPTAVRTDAGMPEDPAEQWAGWSGPEPAAPAGQPAAAGLYQVLARLRAAAAWLSPGPCPAAPAPPLTAGGSRRLSAPARRILRFFIFFSPFGQTFFTIDG